MIRSRLLKRWGILLVVVLLVVSFTSLIGSYHNAARSSLPSELEQETGYLTQWITMSQRPYRILCWTLTDPFDLEKRTKFVRDTWAKRCDKMLFMSSARNDSFPTVGLNVTAGRNHIGAKAKAAWNYIYEHHRDDADYFIKGDPDTYFVVDNLRRYLASRDPRVPEFFGHRLFITGPNVTYVSGGSGLVISRESLNRLIAAFQQTPDCLVDGQGEDWKTARCMATKGVKAVDTRDVEGRETFMMLSTMDHMMGSYPKWYLAYDINKAIKGPDCCSRNPISFHYVSQINMQILDYYLHTVREKRLTMDNSPLHFISANQSIPNPT